MPIFCWENGPLRERDPDIPGKATATQPHAEPLPPPSHPGSPHPGLSPPSLRQLPRRALPAPLRSARGECPAIPPARAWLAVGTGTGTPPAAFLLCSVPAAGAGHCGTCSAGGGALACELQLPARPAPRGRGRRAPARCRYGPSAHYRARGPNGAIRSARGWAPSTEPGRCHSAARCSLGLPVGRCGRAPRCPPAGRAGVSRRRSEGGARPAPPLRQSARSSLSGRYEGRNHANSCAA